MTNEAFQSGAKPKENNVYRKLAVLTSFTALMASGARAQDPKVEIGAVVNWTLSDGVTGDAVTDRACRSLLKRVHFHLVISAPYLLPQKKFPLLAGTRAFR